jgi:hypothetical protein
MSTVGAAGVGWCLCWYLQKGVRRRRRRRRRRRGR